MATYNAPANLNDFDSADDPATRKASWHQLMSGIVNVEIDETPAFYDSLNPPNTTTPIVASPPWDGLPRTIKRLNPGSIADAAALVDLPISMGNTDPMMGRYTPNFFRTNGQVYVGPAATVAGQLIRTPAYRPQDEYLEWIYKLDADQTIKEIVFTCEGPEYWDEIAKDEGLLVTMYQDLVGDNSIQIDDLVYPETVTWDNPNRRGPAQTFAAGTYNPYNKWNIEGAVHLTQPANTLGAEIFLAKDASRLYGNPVPVTTDPDLVCCGAYGGINRMSDPTIGLSVNTQVGLGNSVSLRNPIGLYIKDIDRTQFAFPDGTPMPVDLVDQCWEILRPKPENVTDMIVRARFRVPDGITHDGEQLRVGDLMVKGEKITAAGQVADVITMTLFALAIPGAPPQERQVCQFRPCPDPTRPEFIVAIPFGQQCSEGGVSPMEANAMRSVADRRDFALDESVEEPLRELPPSRFGYSRGNF